MRQVTRKGLMTMAAATGVIAATGGYAHADSAASGSSSNSPGVLSGNTVQAPVNVPVNVCGNTVNVVGILNPAMGNTCVNHGGGEGARAGGHASDSPGVGSGNHVEAPIDVPVNACGNSVDVIGVGNAAAGNDCANGGGSGSGDRTTPPGDGDTTPPGKPGQPNSPEQPGQPGSPEQPGQPGSPEQPGDPVERGMPGHPDSRSTSPASGDERRGGSSRNGQLGGQSVVQPQGTAQLAHTGGDLPLGAALSVGAGALLAGAVLYRKARALA